MTVQTEMPNIYLDHQATTPLDPRVMEAMHPYFSTSFANAHASTYLSALSAQQAIENSRRKIARAINAMPQDLVFTSGATESNNTAILGIASAAKGLRTKLVTQTTEHKSVLEPVESLRDQGFDVCTVKVDGRGVVDPSDLKDVIDEKTLLVSVMLVNNETGVIQPLQEIAEICSRFGVLLHCDCAQALGKIPVDVRDLGINLASFSAHKIYGPKGVGALWVQGLRQAAIDPIMRGGGQEGGLRPGTLPVPLCVGFGVAAELVQSSLADDLVRIKGLEELLWQAILDVIPNAELNGHLINRAPGCLNVSFSGYSADFLIDKWRELEVSKGSACESTKTRSSHVLRSMGVSRSKADTSIRLSIGRFTSEDEIDQVISIIKRSISTNRERRQ